jgi:hypothetical protein
MALVGISYLAFEDVILGTTTRKDSLSRTIVGVQVSDSKTLHRSMLMRLDWIDLSRHGGDEVSSNITTVQTRTSSGNTIDRVAGR